MPLFDSAGRIIQPYCFAWAGFNAHIAMYALQGVWQIVRDNIHFAGFFTNSAFDAFIQIHSVFMPGGFVDYCQDSPCRTDIFAERPL
jgi:hypothetical protein